MHKSQNLEVKAKITRKWKKKYNKKKVSTDKHRRTPEDMNSCLFTSITARYEQAIQKRSRIRSRRKLSTVTAISAGNSKSDHALDLVRSDPGIQAVINLA
jgi:hypothetical protein